MSQPPKTAKQIQAMRESGKILGGILRDLKQYVQAGMTGVEVDSWVHQQIVSRGAEATYLTSEVGFPNSICISVNDAIVHGVPTDEPFQVGDVIGFDLVIAYRDMKTDSAFTMVVGEKPTGAKKHLMAETERSLEAGIKAIRGAGTRTGDIGAAVQAVLDKAKLGIIRDMVGHGVGQEMHMAPDVPNVNVAGSGTVLKTGDTIAIEPMATLGGWKVNGQHDDGWTISTRDGSLAAHFEHTVLITETGAEVLTRP